MRTSLSSNGANSSSYTFTADPCFQRFIFGEFCFRKLFIAICLWALVYGNLFMGTCLWEHVYGNMFTGTCVLQLIYGNLFMGTYYGNFFISYPLSLYMFLSHFFLLHLFYRSSVYCSIPQKNASYFGHILIAIGISLRKIPGALEQLPYF